MRCEFFEFIEFIEFIELIEFIEFIELPGTPHKHNYDQGGSPQADLLLGRLPSLLPFVQEFWQGTPPSLQHSLPSFRCTLRGCARILGGSR